MSLVLLLLVMQVTFTNPSRELFLGFVKIKLEFLDMSKFASLEFIDRSRIFPKTSHWIVTAVPLVVFDIHSISSRPPSGTVYCQPSVTFDAKASTELNVVPVTKSSNIMTYNFLIFSLLGPRAIELFQNCSIEHHISVSN